MQERCQDNSVCQLSCKYYFTKFCVLKEKQKKEETLTNNAIVSEAAGNIARRAVPVHLKNGSRKLKVNALLDDASTKTYYANADVSAELGLTVFSHRVYVSVLNGEVESF